MVIKEHVEIFDVELFGLDRLDPPTRRFPFDGDGQEMENEFARQLMRAGGKFWRIE